MRTKGTMGPGARQRAFLDELELTSRCEESAKALRELNRKSHEIRAGLDDLQTNRSCLVEGLDRWTRLSEVARRNRQGSEVVAKKYPLQMRSEGARLKEFYRKVDERLRHERHDIESRVLANDVKMEEVRAKRRSCRAEQVAEFERYTLLLNRVEDCKELQRHCIFSRTLWRPTPCG
mmetsp:Transcript_6817/g.24574  ORF Transcript_6817/g.24574 Transcript_6817/m.24574 type:complete len:177 (-) Transcript_6817:1015-1545(-)